MCSISPTISSPCSSALTTERTRAWQPGEEYDEYAAQPSPVRVLGLDDANDIAVGNGHACALRGAGEVACWGRNLQGQLGDGTTDDRNVPVAFSVHDVTGALEIGTGITSLGGSYYLRIGSCALFNHGATVLGPIQLCSWVKLDILCIARMPETAKRYLHDPVSRDLDEKMVFISGPRQVGKTTLALQLAAAADTRHPAYLSWDDVRARPRIRRGELPVGQRRIIFNEIHKYARWRGLVKGLYDTREPGQSFIITGSARLDVYRRGGDSLHGRYHPYRLHPFSLSELGGRADALSDLLRFGGFPEPFLRGNATHWSRWQRERIDRIVRDDIRDLERVREISLIELLVDALPSRVGSPLSVKNLREDLEVAHDTAERWIGILENLYVCFRVAPLGAARIRAVKKERKLYLWDWSAVPEAGPRLENLVASQLLKLCHYLEDTEGHRMELRFLRDTDGREVDFVVLKGRKPMFAVEVKTGERGVSPAVRYFKDRVSIPRWYQVHLGTNDVLVDGVRVLPLASLCREVGIP